MNYTITTSRNLTKAINWLEELFRLRLKSPETTELVPVPVFEPNHDSFTQLINKYKPSYAELTALLLALTPHLVPGWIDQLFKEVMPEGGMLAEAGGARGSNHRGIIPTGETVLWLLAGSDIGTRIHVWRMFRPEHWFIQKNVLRLEVVREGEPEISGRLQLDSEFIELLLFNKVSPPLFSSDFPAEHIETEMEWEDLVLNPQTLRQIFEIEHWIQYNDKLMQDFGMKKKVKPGYRALFYGPPGTGKTLTATLLGKYTHKEVYRIDLSRVVSKYIGETEKNLSKLFAKAESKNWILFFDEADALFGKRTDIRDAHDKYANQEVAYLLQRVETYNGLVILATNQRSNIDDAFVRRFQNIIHFPMPRPEERFELWKKSFPVQIETAGDINWQQLASRYELTGSSILNIAHYCSISALADQSLQVDLKRLEAAILREYVKDGKVV